MLTSILIITILRFRKQHPEAYLRIIRRAAYAVKILSFIIFQLLYFSCSAAAQERSLRYKVKRNGNEIGYIHLQEKVSGDQKIISLESKIVVKMLLSFTALAVEESTFFNGKLVHSSLHRKLNGKEKVNHKVRATASGYVVAFKDKVLTLPIKNVTYSSLCMYTIEPTSDSVFSDKHQAFVAINRTGNHSFRLKFPDGSSNEYFYMSGVCVKIKVNTAFYEAVVELDESSSGTKTS